MSTWQKITSQKPRLLAWFLRFEAAVETLAFVAVVMPHAWMAIAHRWLGLGELPDAPLLDYMIRSVSFLYGLHGVLLWILATDTVRFRPLIIYAAVSYLASAVVFTLIDLRNEMPWWWTASEVGSVLCYGLLLGWLLRD